MGEEKGASTSNGFSRRILLEIKLVRKKYLNNTKHVKRTKKQPFPKSKSRLVMKEEQQGWLRAVKPQASAPDGSSDRLPRPYWRSVTGTQPKVVAVRMEEYCSNMLRVVLESEVGDCYKAAAHSWQSTQR